MMSSTTAVREQMSEQRLPPRRLIDTRCASSATGRIELMGIVSMWVARQRWR